MGMVVLQAWHGKRSCKTHHRIRSYENEMIWEKLFRNTFWGMSGGTVVFGGISGLDIALWISGGKRLERRYISC